MRKFTPILFCLAMLLAGPALAADNTLAVPDTWSEALQQSTREMVRAGIPAQDAIAMTSSMIQGRFSRQQIQQAQQVVVKAHQKGLPVAPVISKALEGVAKQVPPRSVIRAMERVQSRYAYAFKQASRLSTQKADIVRMGNLIAASLAAGMTHRDVNKMVGRLHDQTSRMSREDRRALATNALVTARDMARQGVTSAHAAQVVDRALQQGFKAHEMQALHVSFMSRSTTVPADQLARGFSKSIHEGTFSAMDVSGSHSRGMESHGQTPAGMGAAAEHGVIGHGTGDMNSGVGMGHGSGAVGHGSGDVGPGGDMGGDMGGHGGAVGGGGSGGDMGGTGGVGGSGGGSPGGDAGGHGGAVGGGASGGDMGGAPGGDSGGHGGAVGGGASGGDMGGHGGMGGSGGSGGPGGGGDAGHR